MVNQTSKAKQWIWIGIAVLVVVILIIVYSAYQNEHAGEGPTEEVTTPVAPAPAPNQ